MGILEIPLGPERFRWFMMTHWVLCPDNWSGKILYPGKNILIRQGKSGTALPGIAVRVVRGSLNQVLNKVDHEQLIPGSGDRGNARAMAQKFVGTDNTRRYVAIKWRVNHSGI